MEDIKKKLKKYKAELIKLYPQIKDKRKQGFIKDTIDIVELQIKDEYNNNDIIICNLAESILHNLNYTSKFVD